jgi:DNA-binding transcriptional LysR family regulator
MRNLHGMSELTITGLRVVREVAARGSFSAAADALGYTQSAVSRQVAAMEAAAGVPLFERRPRGAEPTRAGRALLGHGAAVLEHVEAARLELAGMRDRLEGRLTVGAFPTALSVLVPRALARLREAHPALVVLLREGGTPAHLRRLRAGRLEVATVATGDGLEPYDLSGLRAERVIEGGLMVAVGSGHHLAGRDTVDVAELEHEAWIVAGGEPPQFDVWPAAPGKPRVAHAVRDWPGRLGLVAAGLGIAVVPEIVAGAMPPGVRLIAVDEANPVRRAVLAVTRPERSPGAAALVEALRAEGAALSR